MTLEEKFEAANAEVKFMIRRLQFIKKHVTARRPGARFVSSEEQKFFNQLFDLSVLFEEEK